MKYLVQICTTVITVLLFVVGVSMATTSCSAKNPMNHKGTIVMPQFNEEIHSSNMFTVLFHYEIGNIELGIVPTKTEEGQVQIGIESFDKIAREFDFIEMFQNRLFFCHSQIEDGVWNGYFPNNYFSVTIKDGSKIQDAVTALFHDSSVQEVCYTFFCGYGPNIVQNSLLICFDYNTLGIFEWGFEATINESGQVQTGIESFDNIAVKYNFTDMLQLHFRLEEASFAHKHNLVRNVFRITVKDNDVLIEAVQELILDTNVLAVNYDINFGCHALGDYYFGGEQ